MFTQQLTTSYRGSCVIHDILFSNPQSSQPVQNQVKPLEKTYMLVLVKAPQDSNNHAKRYVVFQLQLLPTLALMTFRYVLAPCFYRCGITDIVLEGCQYCQHFLGFMCATHTILQLLSHNILIVLVMPDEYPVFSAFMLVMLTTGLRNWTSSVEQKRQQFLRIYSIFSGVYTDDRKILTIYSYHLY